jgi:hypothetical protein
MDEEKLEAAYNLLCEFRDAFIKLFRKVFKSLLDKWEQIKEFAEQYVERKSIPKQTWLRQSVTTVRSQIIYRKPRIANARSCC